ncbi:MAG: DUF1192 domain-containing protein [Rhodospirillales bacterium]|nr:DUF1192 domain-containing protein [Rhodospirillales bacterium]
MDIDDVEPKRPTAKPRNLETMSIEALKDYVAELEAEIGRARAMINSKEGARASADSVFKI